MIEAITPYVAHRRTEPYAARQRAANAARGTFFPRAKRDNVSTTKELMPDKIYEVIDMAVGSM
jgi:hypothetical protein